MSSPSSALEGQQTALLMTNNPPRNRWRLILRVLQVRQVLISLVHETRKTSYGVISTNDIEITNIEVSEIAEISPHVSIEVHSGGEQDNAVSGVKLQHENIAKIIKTRDLDSLQQFGGVQGIAEALNTDLDKGLTRDEEALSSQSRACPLSKTQDPASGFFKIIIKSGNSSIIFLLFVSAVLSIIFGIKEEGPQTGWYEGALIIFAIIILVVAQPVRDFLREHFKKLSEEQKPLQNRQAVVDVLREGNLREVPFSGVVMGDVVCLKRGCLIPGDGLLISGERIKVDDSFASSIDDQNPFLFYGSKVINGYGYMLVTSVGMDTAWGQMMSQVTTAPNKTQLPAQLDRVGTRMQLVGLLISILILVAQFLRFKLGKEKDRSGLPDLKGQRTVGEVMDLIKRIVWKPNGKISVLTTSLATFLVGVVEGFPFVISLSILYWNKKILSNEATAQEEFTSVSMGSITTICTDKTGGLTLNLQEVEMCYIGNELINEDSVIAVPVIEALCNGICVPFRMSQSPHSSEDSLLFWAATKLGIEMDRLRQSCTIVKAQGLSSADGASRVLMKKNRNDVYSHWKGPATTILDMCSLYYDSDGAVNVIDGEKRLAFKKDIQRMHSIELKTIGFAHKPQTDLTFEDDNLIWIAVLGLRETHQDKTMEAIRACQDAGVNIVLVSEDSVATLEAIAHTFGIPNGENKLVLEGESFRNFTHEERMEKVDKVSILGNSLPSDRLLLVKCLKQKNETVAIVGFRTNETPALREADVGIAMGAWSSGMARNSSDMVITNEDFSFLVTILSCGRCIYDNIQKYIQLELIINITGLLISIATAICFGDSAITAIQMVWVNFLITILGGLALLLEPPTEKLMKKPPVRKSEPFITKAMWRNIMTQVCYQTAILVAFKFKRQAILQINEKVAKAMIFNAYALCQVFNLFNTSDQRIKNLFQNVRQKLQFWVAVVIALVMQAAFIEIAHFLVGSAQLNGAEWGICFLIGMLSCVIDWAVKLISDTIMAKLTRPSCLHTGSRSESAANLELPLISDTSTTTTS